MNGWMDGDDNAWHPYKWMGDCCFQCSNGIDQAMARHWMMTRMASHCLTSADCNCTILDILEKWMVVVARFHWWHSSLSSFPFLIFICQELDCRCLVIASMVWPQFAFYIVQMAQTWLMDRQHSPIHSFMHTSISILSVNVDGGRKEKRTSGKSSNLLHSSIRFDQRKTTFVQKITKFDIKQSKQTYFCSKAKDQQQQQQPIWFLGQMAFCSHSRSSVPASRIDWRAPRLRMHFP